jgi:hypothetical protein
MKASHTKGAILLLLLWLAWAGAPENDAVAQQPAAKQGIALRTRGRRSVVVRDGGRAHVLDLSQHIEAMRIEDATELSRTSKGGFVYLVLEVCGLSKVPPDDRQCGAGIECDLVWLKLDDGWRERDAKSVRYESCWQPITSDEGPKVNGRTVLLVYDDLRDNTRREVSYDADKPGEGLTEKSRPMPKDNP